MTTPTDKDAATPDALLSCAFCGKLPSSWEHISLGLVAVCYTEECPARGNLVRACVWNRRPSAPPQPCAPDMPVSQREQETIDALAVVHNAAASFSDKYAVCNSRLIRECDDIDKILAAFEIGVEQSRSEGGSLRVAHVIELVRSRLAADAPPTDGVWRGMRVDGLVKSSPSPTAGHAVEAGDDALRLLSDLSRDMRDELPCSCDADETCFKCLAIGRINRLLTAERLGREVEPVASEASAIADKIERITRGATSNYRFAGAGRALPIPLAECITVMELLTAAAALRSLDRAA